MEKDSLEFMSKKFYQAMFLGILQLFADLFILGSSVAVLVMLAINTNKTLNLLALIFAILLIIRFINVKKNERK